MGNLTPEQESQITMLALNPGEGWPDGIVCVFLPGGLLVERSYDYGREAWHVDVWTDATKILGSWYMGCAMGRKDEVVTLKDVCTALSTLDNIDLLSKMQHMDWMLAAVGDVVTSKVEPYKDANALGLSWSTCIEANSVINMDFPSCHVLQDGKDGKPKECAVDFLRPAGLANCPIVLDENWELQKASKPFGKFRRVAQARRQFTLGDVLTGLFYELTWHGPLNGFDELERRLDKGSK